MLLDKGNQTVVIQSIEDLDNVMGQLIHVFKDLFNNSHMVKIRSRCNNCLDVIQNTIFSINNDVLQIDDETISCNFPQDGPRKLSLSFNKPSYFSIEYKDDDKFKVINYELYTPHLFEVSLTPYYSPEDYEIHGYYVYKDKNIIIKIRNNDDRTIISFQDFIDFKGLHPMYAHTLVFYHNK